MFEAMTEVVEHREGETRARAENLLGERSMKRLPSSGGVTHDPEFEKWRTRYGIMEMHLAPKSRSRIFEKKSLSRCITRRVNLATAHKVYRCWVSDFPAQPDLDANANAVAIQSIKLENEGWERDAEVPEPTEAVLTE